MKELNDTSFYKILPNNPTSTHCKLINCTINRFQESKQLENKITESLKTIEARKHKENILGRQLYSINSHTTKISEFVDYYLQPFVKSLR